MLKFYFATIVFYIIVLFGAVCVTAKKIQENGWLEGHTVGEKKSGFSWLEKIAVISFIPVFRFLMVIAFFIMAIFTKEQFDEWKDTLNKK